MKHLDIIFAVLFIAFIVAVYFLSRRGQQSSPTDLKQYEAEPGTASSKPRHGWGGFGLLSNMIDSAQAKLHERADSIEKKDAETKSRE